MASTADPFSNAIWSSWSNVWNPTVIVKQGQGLRLSNSSSYCSYRIIWHAHIVRFHHHHHPHWSSTSTNRLWNCLTVGLHVERTEYFNWAPQREADFFLHGVRFTEWRQWKQMPNARQAHTWTWPTHMKWPLETGYRQICSESLFWSHLAYRVNSENKSTRSQKNSLDVS